MPEEISRVLALVLMYDYVVGGSHNNVRIIKWHVIGRCNRPAHQYLAARNLHPPTTLWEGDPSINRSSKRCRTPTGNVNTAEQTETPGGLINTLLLARFGLLLKTRTAAFTTLLTLHRHLLGIRSKLLIHCTWTVAVDLLALESPSPPLSPPHRLL